MNILISGAGIAGLTLAYWLVRRGHEVTLVEKSRGLRGDGYMIDFFGSGYDVAERMGLLPALEAIHYPVPRFVFVDANGRERFSVSYAALRRLFDNRHFNFMRGDLEGVLYARVKEDVRLRFGTTVESFRQAPEGPRLQVSLSDGTVGEFDLLVGADGVHSQVRKLAFGDEEQFTRFLGYYTAAFVLEDWPAGHCATDALSTLTVPGRQVAVYPIRGGKLATFFIYKAHRRVADFSPGSAARELRAAYAGLGWIVPALLERCDRPGIYFDEVSQVQVPRWSSGRVALVGDACQCVSLIAGQGASLAMAGAYVLAEEVARAGDDLPGALRRYQERVKPRIERKHRAGRRLARWFVPESRVRQAIGDLFTRMAEWPVVWRLLRRALAPESILPPDPLPGSREHVAR
jgi:2-polyprenyl-6-methoxyphenol hydroxylase-like FAD-dependent oxidoreductase